MATAKKAKEEVKEEKPVEAPVEAPKEEPKTEAPKAEEKPAKKSGSPITVFYRELTPSGERKGAVASKLFSSEKEAKEFAEATGGRIR